MLLWIDGFEGYGTTEGSAPLPSGVMGRKYTVTQESVIDIEAGRLGGYCIELNATEPDFSTPSLTTNATTIVGFAFKITGAGTPVFCSLYTNTTQGMNLQWAGAGEIAIRRGSTVLETTSGLSLLTDVWYWCEFKVLCNDSTGTYEVRINGVDVASDTGVDTKAHASLEYHDIVKFDSAASSVVFIDDFYMCDGSGAVNNNFLGNCRVLAIFPTGNNGTPDWTPSSGDNYTCVDEEVVDDDTSYIEDSTTDNTDLYTYEDVSDLGDVFGIQINTMCRETDATNYTLKTQIKSDSTVSDDAGQVIGATSYLNKKRISELDPHTSTAWTATTLNAASFGIKLG